MADHPMRLCYCGVFALTLSKTVKEGEESHIALLCIFFLTTLVDYMMFKNLTGKGITYGIVMHLLSDILGGLCDVSAVVTEEGKWAAQPF